MALSPKAILRFTRPPYLFRPLQLLKRLRHEYFQHSKTDMVVTLPWGWPIKIDPSEAIGYNIACQGLYEIAVTETLWRLADAGEVHVDVGANIGYTASVLGRRAGPTGRIWCFEPHPEVFAALQQNIQLWENGNACPSFFPHQIAIGEANGQVFLHTDAWFKTNRGTAWISSQKVSVGDPHATARLVSVRTLDGLLPQNQTIGVAKIDVEGNALSVLRGMTHLLQQRRVRDIVFEEENCFPAPTHTLLKENGYAIFGLEDSFWGVKTLPSAPPRYDQTFGPKPNYLATLKPERAMSRLRPPIWRSFGVGRFLPQTLGVSTKMDGQ
jgi:FkbM family methyltransferase